jgi:hypothetical protein
MAIRVLICAYEGHCQIAWDIFCVVKPAVPWEGGFGPGLHESEDLEKELEPVLVTQTGPNPAQRHTFGLLHDDILGTNMVGFRARVPGQNLGGWYGQRTAHLWGIDVCMSELQGGRDKRIGWDTNIVHGGHFTASGIMRQTGIGVRDLANDLPAVVHTKYIGFVVEAVGAFLDVHTAVGADG